MKKFLILILVLACLIPFVSGETFSGDLDSSATGVYTNYVGTYSGYPAGSSLKNLTIGNIENSGGLNSWIYFYVCGMNTMTTCADANMGTNVSAQTPFVAHIGNTQVGTGVVGYQRIFNWLGVEQPGYFWIIFNTWDQGSKTGTKLLNLTYNGNDIYNLHSIGYGAGPSAPGVRPYIHNNNWGSFTISTIYPFHNSYQVTQPSGLGIQGFITKNFMDAIYPSKCVIYNQTSGTIAASESAVNPFDFNFTILTVSPMVLSVLDNQGNWYNRSFTFASQLPTPTPTQTAYPNVTVTTPVPGAGNETPPAVPNGMVRSWVMVRNSQTAQLIQGANIDLHDNLANTWHNSTGDLDGNFWIDTLPNDNININLDYPGVYYPSSAQGQPTPTLSDFIAGNKEKTFNEVMYPITAIPVELVTFEVRVEDSTTKNAILENVQISVKYATSQQGGATGNTGTESFVVPNNTVLTITSSDTASGYKGVTKIVNSGPTAWNVTYLDMSKGGPTAVPTITKTGAIPTKTIITGNATPIPVTTPQRYNGFWAPLADALSTMGADVTTIGILLAALFIFLGVVVGGWSSAPFMQNAQFNLTGSIVGGVFGFLLAVAFNFIPFVYLIAVIFLIIFGIIFFRT